MNDADVFIASDNILSPLGLTTAVNFSQLTKGLSGIRQHDDTNMSDQPFYAALFGKDDDLIKRSFPAINRHAPATSRQSPEIYTKFERLLIASIGTALPDSGIDAGDKRTVLIVSTTKGNISLLETAANRTRPSTGSNPVNSSGFAPGWQSNTGNLPASRLHALASDPTLKERIALHTSARLVAEYFQFNNPPIVVSNACISGIMAILTGLRLIRGGMYDNAVIAGADVISNFVLSGFQSFQAISSRPCRPFDKTRDGITLGEGAATVVLSSQKRYAGGIKVMGGSTSNDANHLSAPSRTGAELAHSITTALGQAGLSAADIGFISAHGTATIYNDEMEAKAITLAHLQSAPVNSLKGYYGHTLGAAGLIESIVAAQSLKDNLVIPTLGFEEIGVSQPLNICSTLLSAPVQFCLKTASGFGGCNAALVLGK